MKRGGGDGVPGVLGIFPRHHRRGLIEAERMSTIAEDMKHFRVITDAASLKRRECLGAERDRDLFPRHHRRGLIEAWDKRGG